MRRSMILEQRQASWQRKKVQNNGSILREENQKRKNDAGRGTDLLKKGN